ncbi:MAG: UpxY family transcription antiterminator, partial [Ignavibacteria bacterium]|nr:UpxY family transcription antiterminator [Ignavibacteria bacterium]
WFVLRTKPRNEKKVYQQIISKDIEVFLPLLQTVRIWSDRKKKIFVPLFPSYLFIHGNEDERLKAIQGTIGAIGYLMYMKRPAIVTEREIENIKISLKEPERIKVDKLTIKEGDLVEITSGPFRGMTGIIIELRGSYKLVVNIIELNASINIELTYSEVKLLKTLKN